jgi:two-component system NtrC family sensor kinase
MTNPGERELSMLRLVTERVRAMGPSSPRPAPSAGATPAELEELMSALDQLDARYEEHRAQRVEEAKRHMADLEELQHANRLVTVGTLTVGMAHEFGTPLGVVLARAQMILDDELDLVEVHNDAREIVAQVHRMTQMCREVLDYARPKPPVRNAVDLAQIARQMVALLLPDARKRNAMLIVEGNPPPAFVLGNSSKLMQILTNLIINAAQAMPKGGTVTVSLEKKRVDPPPLEGLTEAEYLCLHVRDTGTGIHSGDLAHIFETFFTTKKAGEGTGLGLAVSYRIAREHGGWIGVVTEEGIGTCFTLYVPPIDAPL